MVAGAEHAAAEPAICHHSGPDAAAPAIPQAGHAVSRIGMRTGKNAGMGGHTGGAGGGDGRMAESVSSLSEDRIAYLEGLKHSLPCVHPPINFPCAVCRGVPSGAL